jgi:hypothetical protein
MEEEGVKSVVRLLIREEVDSAFEKLEGKFSAHFDRTERLLTVLESLGSAEDVRARLVFINGMIRREERRDKLRTAVIEKSLIVAVIAALGFVLSSAWDTIVHMVKGG